MQPIEHTLRAGEHYLAQIMTLTDPVELAKVAVKAEMISRMAARQFDTAMWSADQPLITT